MSNRQPDFYTSVLAAKGKISGQLQNKDGTIPDVTGATLTFLMRLPGAETYQVMSTADATVPEEGKWEYLWQDGDRDVPGDFKVNILVEYPDGQTDTYPEPGYVMVRVSSDD